MLDRRILRVVKIAHVISAGVWVGCLAALLCVLFADAGTSRPTTAGLGLAAYRVHEDLLFAAFVVTLGTGLIFSLFSAWGFFKHVWIATKWALALLLFGATMFFQSPAIAALAAFGNAGADAIGDLHRDEFFATSLWVATLQLTVVVAIFAISTLKPWGKLAPRFVLGRRLQLGLVLGAAAVGIAAAVAGYINLQHYRTLPVPELAIAALADGTHRGTANCGFRYEVEIDIRGGRLVAARATTNRDAHYARLAEAVLPRVVAAQSTQVDGITAATTTSRCLLVAVASAAP